MYFGHGRFGFFSKRQSERYDGGVMVWYDVCDRHLCFENDHAYCCSRVAARQLASIPFLFQLSSTPGMTSFYMKFAYSGVGYSMVEVRANYFIYAILVLF